MKSLTTLGWVAIVVLLLIGFVVGRVSAAPAPKFYICKFVGVPGVDEHLQTGQNPISVSQNAIPNFNGVGSYFADQHGRSFVLVEDTGQPEPNVSECPAPDVPDDPVDPPVDPPDDPLPDPKTDTPEITDEERAVRVQEFEGVK